MKGEACDTDLEDTVYRQLADAAGLLFLDLRSTYISSGIRRKIPAWLARSRRWVPLVYNCRRVVLVVDDPFAAWTGDPATLSSLLGPPWTRRYQFVLAAPSALDEYLDTHYGDDGSPRPRA